MIDGAEGEEFARARIRRKIEHLLEQKCKRHTFTFGCREHAELVLAVCKQTIDELDSYAAVMGDYFWDDANKEEFKIFLFVW